MFEELTWFVRTTVIANIFIIIVLGYFILKKLKEYFKIMVEDD
jgi:hypothetical protein